MKKYISLILLSAICFQLFSCADSTQQPNNTETNPEESTTAQPEVTYDFEGNDFNIIGIHGAMNNFADEEQTGDVLNDTLVERDRKVQEKLNVTLNYTVMSGDSEVATYVQNSVLAGTNDYNMLCGSAIKLSSLGVNDILYDINEIDEIKTDSPEWSTLVAQSCNLNGKLYFLCGDILPVLYTIPGCIFMNCTAASEYNITKDEVYEVVESGKWTLDKLISYTKNKFYDLNDNSVISSTDDDYIGYLSCAGPLATGVLMVGAGMNLCTDTSNGTTVELMNEKTLALIDKMKTLFGEYTANTDSDSFHKTFRENRTIFAQHYTSSAFTRYRDVESDFAILPMPKYDEKQENYRNMMNPWGAAFVAFPNYIDSEYVGIVTQTMAEISYEELRPVVYETCFKVKGARDDKSAEMLDLIFNNLYVDNNAIYDFGSSMSTLSSALFEGKELASAWASIEAKIQSDINDITK